MYRRMIFVSGLLLMLLMLVLTVSVSAKSDMPKVQHTTAAVSTHPSQGDVRVIEGAHADLYVTDDGIMFDFQTAELEEGHVYTAWVAIVNNPENCASTPCAGPDLVTNTNNTNTEITYGDGILIGADKRMEFTGFLPVGDVPEPWYGVGITNPFGAQIFVVINDHGPLVPELATSMLNSYRGGCTDESLPKPFPDTAKSDGEAGPNTCRLIQVAVFQ